MTHESRTQNGNTIRHPGEKFNAGSFRKCLERNGLVGETSLDRLNSFRAMDIEDIAGLLDEVNMGMVGSEETMLSPTTMKRHRNGEETGSFVPVEYRYDLFEEIMTKLKNSPDSMNPSRVGDALALAIGILHPFKDANGRTARVMGFAFSEYYSESSPDYDEDFNYLAQSRDELRKAGITNLPVSYVPSMSQQLDYNDPQSVIRYFDKLLDPSYDNESLYQGIMNQSPAFMSK